MLRLADCRDRAGTMKDDLTEISFINSSVFFLVHITLSNMINKYFSELLRPPVTAMNVGADIVELHLGVGSASVGLKITFHIISKWHTQVRTIKYHTWTLQT